MKMRTTMLALAAAILCGAAQAGDEPQPASRYYQVTYADGKVADLAKAPTTDEGISSVVEFTRYENASGGFVARSTGPTAITVVDSGRTVRRQLDWDGRRWGPIVKPRPQVIILHAPTSQPTSQPATRPAEADPSAEGAEAEPAKVDDRSVDQEPQPRRPGLLAPPAMGWGGPIVRLPITHLGVDADIYLSPAALGVGGYYPPLPVVLVVPGPVVEKIETD
jgi:hypothetical protein